MPLAWGRSGLLSMEAIIYHTHPATARPSSLDQLAQARARRPFQRSGFTRPTLAQNGYTYLS